MVYNLIKGESDMSNVEMPYFSLNKYLRDIFGCKVVKLGIDAGFTCPNRDGSISKRGCIFCSKFGSGDFAGDRNLSIKEQLESQKKLLSKKWPRAKYIAYFQAFTNTYASVDELKKKYYEALSVDDVVGIAIATRPDCIDSKKIQLINEISKTHFVWVELGFQTSNENTAKFINRGYENHVFDNAVEMLNKAGIHTVAHIIVGLPHENENDVLSSVAHVCSCGIKGIKLQLLHVLKDTELFEIYKSNQFDTLSMEEYINIICHCIEIIPKNVVIHRLTGDGARKTLEAPLWSLNKKLILNSLNRILKENNIFQGNKLIETCNFK